MFGRLKHIIPALIMPPIFLALLPPAYAASTITVSGYQLLVDGQPFVVRGINYKPTPYTGASNWGDDWTLSSAVTGADLAKMKEMGANTIRVYVTYERLFNNWDNHDPHGDAVTSAELSRYKTVLAQAQSNGIYVIMNYWLPYGLDYTQPVNRSWHKVRFRKIIDTFKNLSSYPNILMWAFGNENNLNRGPMTHAQLFSYYGEAISEAKAQADTTHPYTVVLGDDLSINDTALTNRAAPVDIWSLNIYQTAQGYSNIINSYALNKPLLFSEFGADAFNNNTRSEDEVSQANFYTDRWNNHIKPNLSASNGVKKVLGGVVFEWNDEWWKAGANNAHDSGGSAGNVPPDNFLNEEWFGISTALPEGSSGPRRYRQAFSAFKNMWATNERTPTGTNSPSASPASESMPNTSPSSGNVGSAYSPQSDANLALNKAAVSSWPCRSPTETAPNAIDGSRSTKWCSGARSKWLLVDLGTPNTVSKVVIKHAGAGGETPRWNTRDYTIQTSTDGTSWSTVVNVNNNTADVTINTFAPRNARYVKLNVITATSTRDYIAARIYELEVY